ncbi:YceI family protein [Ramlibacter sp. 2FC]|uniref:YceI family protein n=1 Tax=Ramlibacter sp. 2FC TaxID=2502188 RepID=UPI0010F59F29|nr:YceI family protein [Ramlibacter sp. 2FC]
MRCKETCLASLAQAAVALLLAAGPAAAQPMAKLVPGESRIAFVSKQMGVPVEGVFKRFDAQIAFDPKKPENGSVALQIDTASASIGVAPVDMELPKAVWFDVARFPKASFQSSAIKAMGDGRYEVLGKLSLKGHARELAVPVTIAQAEGKSVASGSFTLRRLEFQVGDGEWRDTAMVADEVQVRFKLTLSDGL